MTKLADKPAPGQRTASEINLLGVQYAYGNNVPQDADKALALFVEAAERGSPAAMCNYGAVKHNERSLGEAVDSFNSAARLGYNRAQGIVQGIYRDHFYNLVASRIVQANKWLAEKWTEVALAVFDGTQRKKAIHEKISRPEDGHDKELAEVINSKLNFAGNDAAAFARADSIIRAESAKYAKTVKLERESHVAGYVRLR